ncbi:MAG TPA: polysaccharide biosynthesis C-terminal domain-containing protein [Planctomycetota bacterium]|nr:polysaccharide biosynthesis C-terminal domain-containing protein [Planctomycetota bacterium]
MFKSIGSNWIYNLVSLAVNLVLMREVIRAIGVPLNGAWDVVVSSTGFLTLLLLGVPMTSVRWFSQALAANDRPALDRAVATCLGAYLILGVAAALGSLVFFAGFDAWTSPKILEEVKGVALDPPQVVDAARVGFLLMALTIAGGFVSQVPYAILAAHRDFGARNKVMIGALLVRLGLTLALVKSEPAALIKLGAVQVAVVVFEWCAAWATVRRKYPDVRIGLRGFDRGLLREILGFSVFVLFLNLGNQLFFRTSGMVIGWHPAASLSEAKVFESAKSFVVPITEFVVSIAAVVMPTAVRMKAEGRTDALRGVLMRWSKVALGVALLPGLYLVVFGSEFFAAYIDKADFDHATAGSVQRILLLGHFLFLPVRGVALPILTGIGKPRRATVAFLICGALNLAASAALLPRFGLDGVAWAMAAPLALFAAYLLGLVCAELRLPPAPWFGYVFGRAAVGAAVVVAATYALKRAAEPRSLLALVAAGVAYVAVFAAVWVLFVHRGDPHVDPWASLRRRARGKVET